MLASGQPTEQTNNHETNNQSTINSSIPSNPKLNQSNINKAELYLLSGLRPAICHVVCHVH
jgi:hypothetical protein